MANRISKTKNGVKWEKRSDLKSHSEWEKRSDLNSHSEWENRSDLKSHWEWEKRSDLKSHWRRPRRSRITITSMHIPPMAATHQMIPPAPEGEKKVASDMFVAIIVQKSVTVATNRRRIISKVKVIRNITKITAPTIPVSPSIISGKTPFSIGADHSEWENRSDLNSHSEWEKRSDLKSHSEWENRSDLKSHLAMTPLALSLARIR